MLTAPPINETKGGRYLNYEYNQMNFAFLQVIGLKSKANEEIIWENSDYKENIVQGTRKIVRIKEVFQLQRFGLQKVNCEDSLRKIDGDFKYVPIKEIFGLREATVVQLSSKLNQNYNTSSISIKYWLITVPIMSDTFPITIQKQHLIIQRFSFIIPQNPKD